MALTQVSVTYGGKTLDCELSFEPPYMLHAVRPKYIPQDCEFTLEKVSLVCDVGFLRVGYTHAEDISHLAVECNLWDQVEELSIDAINERGYV